MKRNLSNRFTALVIIAAAFTFVIFGPSSALAAQFDLEYILKIARMSFSEKQRIGELVRTKYPGLAGDVLNVIEAKYRDLPSRMPKIVESCFAGGTKGKLKLIRAAVKEFRAGYDGAIVDFVKDVDSKVLSAYPSLADDLMTKRAGLKGLALKHEALIRTLADSKEEIKKIIEARRAAAADELKKAARDNLGKLDLAAVKKAAWELKAFKDENPRIMERVAELEAKYPEMKKPALFLVALAKEPGALSKIAAMADGGLKKSAYEFIDGVLDKLIEEGKCDYFGARADIGALLASKDPEFFFRAARLKMDVKSEMGAFVAEKYPQLPSKVAAILDDRFPGVAAKAFDLLEREQPGLIKGVLTKVRGEFAGLENDIDALLREKYPSLLSDIESGVRN